jgi:transcriptional regulator with XRE-family HTH domain
VLSADLRQLREQRGWSLREAAQASGLSNGYISLLENGRVENPSATVLARLAKGYGVSVEAMLKAAGVVVAAQREHEGIDPDLVDTLRTLSPEARAEVASYASYLARQRRRGRRG